MSFNTLILTLAFICVTSGLAANILMLKCFRIFGDSGIFAYHRWVRMYKKGEIKEKDTLKYVFWLMVTARISTYGILLIFFLIVIYYMFFISH